MNCARQALVLLIVVTAVGQPAPGRAAALLVRTRRRSRGVAARARLRRDARASAGACRRVRGARVLGPLRLADPAAQADRARNP